jgi:hypothetical protein
MILIFHLDIHVHHSYSAIKHSTINYRILQLVGGLEHGWDDFSIQLEITSSPIDE